MKKILVAYATAGIGHKKAAIAVNEALGELKPDAEVKMIDVLDYASNFFKKGYCWTYLVLVNKLIFLWGFFYYLLDIKFVHFLTYPLRRAMHVLNSRGLIDFILKYKPDVIVSTHFLLPDVCDFIKRKYGLKVHVINVVTDYRPHSFWISGGVDTYAVAHENVRDGLIGKWGISPDRVKITGIPIESRFRVKHDKNKERSKLAIPEGHFTVLLSGGGYGVGPLFELTDKLNEVNFPLSVIVICGHNKKLFTRIEDFGKRAKINIVNVGYVNNVEELMAACDLCVGKAGGISTTEAFMQETPFVFVRPIPGQERGNADLFVKIGVGYELKRTGEILSIVEGLRNDPSRLESMKTNIGRAKKPYAARDIAELALSL